MQLSLFGIGFTQAFRCFYCVCVNIRSIDMLHSELYMYIYCGTPLEGHLNLNGSVLMVKQDA